jgi:P27 family predicted phage terminase small subunit
MPGLKPTPVRLKLLRGNPGRRPVRATFEPPQPPTPPDPPAFLDDYARREWTRVAPNLCLFGLLAPSDTMVLAAYCEAVSRWKTAKELLAGLAEQDPAANALLVRGSKGQARANPLIQIAREAAADMYKFACEFGFGPAARSRIHATEAIGDGKFTGLFGPIDRG